MAEKTDTSEKAPRRSRAGKAAKPPAKKDARKAGKKATAAKKPGKTAAKKPAAKKSRKRATKASSGSIAHIDEDLGGRRIAGGRNTKTPGTPETEKPCLDGTQALAAANDDDAAPEPAPGLAPGSAPVEPGLAENRPETVGRTPDAGRLSKTDSRTRAGESAEGGARPNTLVPTNGIHTTRRRIKRKLRQNPGVMGIIAATLLGIIILGEQTQPPDMTDFEQAIAASQATITSAGSRVASTPPGIISSKPEHAPIATPDPVASQISERQTKNLDDGELAEMERLLARLDMGPSNVDGVVDNQTEAAIRLYQEIAGLPIDGAPSRTLLADMREVVKILEDGG